MIIKVPAHEIYKEYDHEGKFVDAWLVCESGDKNKKPMNHSRVCNFLWRMSYRCTCGILIDAFVDTNLDGEIKGGNQCTS